MKTTNIKKKKVFLTLTIVLTLLVLVLKAIPFPLYSAKIERYVYSEYQREISDKEHVLSQMQIYNCAGSDFTKYLSSQEKEYYGAITDSQVMRCFMSENIRITQFYTVADAISAYSNFRKATYNFYSNYINIAHDPTIISYPTSIFCYMNITDSTDGTPHLIIHKLVGDMIITYYAKNIDDHVYNDLDILEIKIPDDLSL